MDSELERLAWIIRCAADDELMPRFRNVSAKAKDDGSLVTEADFAVQNRIAKALQAEWPDVAFLGEEMTTEEHTALLSGRDQSPLWVLDPLDGTINFSSGVPAFCVSLARIDDQGVELALIYDPNHQECFCARRGAGAWLNGDMLNVPVDAGRALKECVAEVDLKRLSESMRVALVQEQPFRSQRNFGSGALDWVWLASGRFQLYLHGGQKLWDYAAGSLIFREAGGIAVSLQGDEVFSGDLAPRSVVGAISTRLAEQWQTWLKVHP